MRTILFRGKGYGNKWYYGNLQVDAIGDTWICKLDGCGEDGFFKTVDPTTVGQFTGFYDSKKKQIFEGDIVQNYYSKERYLVIWQENGFKLTNIECKHTTNLSTLEKYTIIDSKTEL